MGRAAVATALLGAGILAAARAHAAGERFELRYDVHWGPLRLYSMTTRTAVDADRYRMELVMRTEGAVRVLFPWDARSVSEGMMHGDLLRPLRYLGESTYRKRAQHVTIDYLGDGTLRVELDPPPDAEGNPVGPPALRATTIDPHTAMLLLIRQVAAGGPCRGVQHVFDGRLRYDLHYDDGGPGELPPRTGSRYAGPAHLCEARLAPIAGFPDDQEGVGDGPRLRYWFARVFAGRSPVPVRLALIGARGTLTEHLTEADVRSLAE